MDFEFLGAMRSSLVPSAPVSPSRPRARGCLSILVICALQTGCSGDEVVDPGIDHVALSGSVSDGEGPLSGFQLTLHGAETTYPIATATSGTFRLDIPLGGYDVRLAPAPPSTGSVQQLKRVVFDEPGEQTLHIALASLHLNVAVPGRQDSDSVQAAIYWNNGVVAVQETTVREGHADLWFRGLIPAFTPALVAVALEGVDGLYFAPGVTEPESASYLPLGPDSTSTMTFTVPALRSPLAASEKVFHGNRQGSSPLDWRGPGTGCTPCCRQAADFFTGLLGLDRPRQPGPIRG